MDTVWKIRFGKRAASPDYFAFVTDMDGEPVDTFYSTDHEALFLDVASLMDSEATGTGFGVPS